MTEAAAKAADDHADHGMACSQTHHGFIEATPLRRHFVWAERKYISDHLAVHCTAYVNLFA